MSRVFTVSFCFKEKKYTALVSFQSQELESSYLIRYLDQEVETLIPGNKLVVSHSGTIEYPKVMDKVACDLVYKTTEAINGYLQLHET